MIDYFHFKCHEPNHEQIRFLQTIHDYLATEYQSFERSHFKIIHFTLLILFDYFNLDLDCLEISLNHLHLLLRLFLNVNWVNEFTNFFQPFIAIKYYFNSIISSCLVNKNDNNSFWTCEYRFNSSYIYKSFYSLLFGNFWLLLRIPKWIDYRLNKFIFKSHKEKSSPSQVWYHP